MTSTSQSYKMCLDKWGAAHNVGAGNKGLEVLKKIEPFAKTNNSLNINAVAWTGKAYHKWFLWIDWWKQTGEMVTGSTKVPKVSWEDHKKLEKRKKK